MLNSDSTKYGGTGVLNEPEIRSHKRDFLDFQHSAEITLPPMRRHLLPLYPQQARSFAPQIPSHGKKAPQGFQVKTTSAVMPGSALTAAPIHERNG